MGTSSSCQCIFLFVILNLVFFINCFNLDTINYVKQSGPRNSMFGFSVATHEDRGQTWTIIGAPKADSRQPGVYLGGSVYRCYTDRDETCQDLAFDHYGNSNDSQGRQIDLKSEQWFGATVHSGGPNKPIVACAPRYVWFSTKLERRDPVGTCFLCNGDFTDFHEYSPCRTKNWGYHRQGACQAGLGAAVSKDGERLFIGAPGSWYWQGQLYSLDPNVKHPYTVRFGEYGDHSGGQAHAQSIRDRLSVLSTQEGSPSDDDSYMGYSVAVGDFTGEGLSGVAVGMPRGNSGNKKLVGKVVIYTWNLTNHQNISGEQLGSYFGYSIASADIDGDGLDDLVIGAPMHTEKNKEEKYEVGRIYVRYQRNRDFRGRFEKLHTRDGTYSKGRFGLAVASLGDLDRDGYDDIAVGAPYAGDYERGVVYIYYGSSFGLRAEPSQIIYAENITMNLYTFGFSIAGNNIDLDHNEYPDMVVGSYLSDSAVVFKSRPVIKAKGSVLFDIHNKVISLDDTQCTLSDGTRVSCTDIRACLHYNGTAVPRSIDLNVQFVLDARNQKNPRMFFKNNERYSSINQTWRLDYQTMNCNSLKVYLKENIRDKLTPLEVELRYSLRDEEQTYYTRRPDRVLPAMLDRNMPLAYKDKITIRKNCGPDDICIPDLKLIANPSVEKYLLGSGKVLEVDVLVQNNGEDSFESMFYMQMPKGINYFKIEKLNSSTIDIPVQCSSPKAYNNNTLRCDIGNPLPANRQVHFKVLLDPYHEEGMAPSYNFQMWVNSTNPEENQTTWNNGKNMTINIWVETDLSLTGWPNSLEVHYNTSHFEKENVTQESDLGPQIIHWYNLKNNGPSGINQASTVFIWPDQTLAGDDLLILVEKETAGPIMCEYAFETPMKVTADQKHLLQEFLKKQESVLMVNKDDTMTYEHSAVTYGTSSHIHSNRKKTFDEDKFEDTGDASFVHNARAQAQGQTQTSGTIQGQSGSTSGGQVVHAQWSSSWNASNGGSPVETHKESWRHRESSSSGSSGTSSSHGEGSGSTGSGYKFVYTSTSSGTRGQETGSQTGAENRFLISGQQSSTHGTHSQGSEEQTQGGSSGQFSWNAVSSTDKDRDHGGQVQGHRTHSTGTEEQYGSGTGTQGGRAEHRQYSSHREESYSSTGGSAGSRDEGGIHYGASGTGSRVQTEESGRREEHRTQYGTSASGTSGTQYEGSRTYSGHRDYENKLDTRVDHRGHSREQGSRERQGSRDYDSRERQGSRDQYSSRDRQGSRDRTQYGSRENYDRRTQTGSGSGSKQDHFDWDHSGTRTQYGSSGSGTQHGSATQYGSSGTQIHHQGSQYGTSGSGTQYGTSGSSSGQFSSSGRGYGGSRDYDSSGRGGSQRFGTSGTHQNDTHKISWSVERQRNVEGHRGTTEEGRSGAKWHSGVVTEESVNKGIDDYTQGVLTHGHHSSRGHSSREQSQRNRSSYGQYNQSQLDLSQGLGAAAIPGGYRETTLDLGVLGGTSGHGHSTTHNVDVSLPIGGSEEYGYDDENYEYSSSERNYDPDLGSYEDRGGSSRSGVSHGVSRTYTGGRQNSGEAYRRQGSAERRYSSSHQSQHQSSSDGHQSRHRRSSEAGIDPLMDYHCNATHCKTMRCTVGSLKKGEEVWVVLRYRLNAHTIRKLGLTGPIKLSSMMRARIDKLPYIGEPVEAERVIHAHEVETTIVPLQTEVTHEVEPLWIIVLSACAGVLILLLLAFLLYKCGFFKRNRPSDAPEREPLNRNGAYHGDEQL